MLFFVAACKRKLEDVHIKYFRRAAYYHKLQTKKEIVDLNQQKLQYEVDILALKKKKLRMEIKVLKDRER